MKAKFILCLIVFLLAASSAFCETTINSDVDKTTLSVGEELVFKVTVISSERQVSAPKIENFEGFVILSQAESSTVTFDQGGGKSMLVYVYVLTPVHEGTLKIKPVTITVKNKTYATEALSITVNPEIKNSKKPPVENNPDTLGPQTEEDDSDSSLPQYNL